MFHLDNNSGIDVMPIIRQTVSRLSKWFTEGDSQTPPSYPGADWFNIVQAELLNVLKDAEIEPNKAELNQLSQAINGMIEKKQASLTNKGVVLLSSAIDSESETEAATPRAVKIVSDRINDITDKFQSDEFESRVHAHNKKYYFFMSNNGLAGMYSEEEKVVKWVFNESGVLDEGFVPASRILDLDKFVRGSIPAGIPMPWPKSAPPAGWLECNGSPFDVNRFPELAKAYPLGSLPDLRGEFIRGWDNGRKVDPERAILSWQNDAIRNIWGEMSPISETFAASPVATGVFKYFKKQAGHTPTSVDDGSAGGVTFDASLLVPTARENRPRNVAFMYIVKAE